MKRYIKSALAPAAALFISLASTSCLNDLDKEPISPKIDLEVSNDGLFNKCYANFGINGNGSGSNSDDDPDVKGFDDPGMTGLVRAMFNINELPMTRRHAHGATVCRNSTLPPTVLHILG